MFINKCNWQCWWYTRKQGVDEIGSSDNDHVQPIETKSSSFASEDELVDENFLNQTVVQNGRCYHQVGSLHMQEIWWKDQPVK